MLSYQPWSHQLSVSLSMWIHRGPRPLCWLFSARPSVSKVLTKDLYPCMVLSVCSSSSSLRAHGPNVFLTFLASGNLCSFWLLLCLESLNVHVLSFC